MILSFLAPSTSYPVGGNAMIYEFATAMAERGHDVHMYHHFLWGDDHVESLDEIGWYTFRAPMKHHFGVADDEIEPADVFFGWSPAVEENPQWGLPICWIQGYRMYPGDDEEANFRKPCPKICIASWLVDVARSHGVPDGELVHISNALNHDHHRLTARIEGRPPRILWCYNNHPKKGAALAFDVLAEIRRRRPDVEIVAFGNRPMQEPLPPGMTYHHNPDQDVLVQELYNTASIFLWTSEVEGFGLPALEAMACGAALVTTDNGGSRDYAIHDETALVAPYPDRDALVGHVLRLLDDDAERVRIAAAGNELARTFTWERSGEQLEAFLLEYLANPTAHGRPG